MNKKISEALESMVFGKTVTFGTNSDRLFDDLKEYKKGENLFVSCVKVWHGDVIDCLEFVYNDKQYEKGKSPFFHGGRNGYLEEFKIGMGDFIQTIEGEYGRYPYSTEPAQQNKDVIIRIRFITRNGIESKWYGNACGKGDKLKGQNFKIDVGSQSVICALSGATWKENLILHNYIQAIGAYYMTSLDAMKLMELYKNEK